MDELQLGDLVQMRKTHPCGSDKWTVIRVGADIKIRCSGCGRIVMMDRADFTKRMKKVIEHTKEPIRGTNETDSRKRGAFFHGAGKEEQEEKGEAQKELEARDF